MYLLCLSAMMVASVSVKAQDVTITLEHGSNWISYPRAEVVDISTALGDFTPMEGDVIKSHNASSSYINGRWRGSVTQFMPGWGYNYHSQRAEAVDVVLSAPVSQFTVITAEPTNITTTSAVVGGTVDVPEGTHVFLRGVCWGTQPNPDM